MKRSSSSQSAGYALLACLNFILLGVGLWVVATVMTTPMRGCVGWGAIPAVLAGFLTLPAMALCLLASIVSCATDRRATAGDKLVLLVPNCIALGSDALALYLALVR